MSETLTTTSKLENTAKPLTLLQELEKQKRELQTKMRDEKRRIKRDRLNKLERSHVMMILGSIIDRSGKEKIAQVLEKNEWLKANDKLAVEYYYGLRVRPANAKKPVAPLQNNEADTR